jgi:hypothetical protein
MPAWIPVALAAAGAATSAIGSNQASKAQQGANNAAINEQKREFDLIYGDYAPYRNIGKQAINTLGSIYGYGSGDASGTSTSQAPLSYADWSKQNGTLNMGTNPLTGRGVVGQVGNYVDYQNYLKNFKPTATAGTSQTAAGPDYSAFFASPDYNFRRTEGMRGIQGTAAARGGAFSGNALKALNEYNSNLASGEFGNYFARQAQLAGIGQGAVNSSSAAGQNMANNVSGLMQDTGMARASGISSIYNGIGGLLGSFGKFAGMGG